MVMETPSAQCVGREFVRQYYTLLHEAPDYLHRFYSHNSCFVHGGVEKPGEEQPPVMGQNDIHKKIVSLKFRDCHAKIRQVDSQPTVANAVVVQVTGELSNNGQPMRRFMQTFVLAPQSPKKYYVHNDIFRYQDEVFHDLDTDTEAADDSAVECEAESEPAAPALAESVQEPVVYYDQQQTLSNGGTSEERAESPVEEKVAPVAAPEPEEPAAAPAEPEPVYEEVKEEAAPEPEPEPEVPVQPQEPPKPFSWAALASQKPQQPVVAMQPAPKPAAPAPQAPKAEPAKGGPEGKPQRAPRPPRADRPPPRDNSRSAPSAAPGENDDPNRQRPISKVYPDTQQLFVGNLPHNIGEPELQEFFDQYGKVVEVRINRKSSATNRDVPNFGFVVFASPESVTKVLDLRPIHLRDDIRLNVEEKKQRGEQTGRPGSGNRMGRGGGPGMVGRGGGGPPRGGRGGGPPSGRGDRGRGGDGNRGGFGRPR